MITILLYSLIYVLIRCVLCMGESISIIIKAECIIKTEFLCRKQFCCHLMYKLLSFLQLFVQLAKDYKVYEEDEEP
jgi:hypothetical protein